MMYITDMCYSIEGLEREREREREREGGSNKECWW